MTYDFERDYPQSMMADGKTLIKHPVWGGNINGYSRNRAGPAMVEVRALVLHTPEEAADNHESTPIYFATKGVMRSTHDYADNDGDLYQMVSHKDAAWGQGTHEGNRTWKGAVGAYAPWCPVGESNNQYSIGIEIEGRASTIHQTLGRAQYSTVARWIAYNCTRYGIPLDRDHIVGHNELARDKTDPGKLPIDELIKSAQGLIRAGIAVHPNGLKPVEPVMTQPSAAEAYRAGYRGGFQDAKSVMYGEVNSMAAAEAIYVPERWRSR